MKVPFLDLKAQYASIKDEIDDAIGQVVESCAFAGGPFVEKFEHEFAEFCSSRYAVCVGSGTEALWLTLSALGIGKGDEVITVPNTFIATVEAISLCGATPVFVDVNEDTLNIDVESIEEAVTRRTKAIIPVHLCGRMVDMFPILNIAEKYGLHIIEDACQAHGAEYHGHMAGTMGIAGCFSFYPGKNLGAFGDAGAVVTNRADVTQALRNLRDHGQSAKYHHKTIGWNSRMDGIQGAVLSVKLRHLRSWNKARQKHADNYARLLENVDGITFPIEEPNISHVYHLYPIMTENRDELLIQLEKLGVHCGIHYPIPIHLQPAYRMLGHKPGDFPHAESISKRQLSLPMYPQLTDEQTAYVAEALTACLPQRCIKKMAKSLQGLVNAENTLHLGTFRGMHQK